MINDDVVFQDHPSWRSYLGTAVIGAISTMLVFYGLIYLLPKITTLYPRIHNKLYPGVYTLPFIIILIFIFIIIYQRYSYLYTVTRKEVISRHGIIARNTNNALISKITDTNIRQNIIQRLLRTGSVYINTAGGPGMEVIFLGVNDPFLVQEIITHQRESKTGGD